MGSDYRDCAVGTMLTSGEWQALMSAASDAGLSTPEYLRMIVLETLSKPKQSHGYEMEIGSIYEDLRGVKVELAQLREQTKRDMEKLFTWKASMINSLQGKLDLGIYH